MKIEQRIEKIEKEIEELKKLNHSQDIEWTLIGDLEWSENLGEMNWLGAKKKCEELGGRLPTRTELINLYDNHKGELESMDNNDTYFWSATENSSTDAWAVYLSGGDTDDSSKTNAGQVRCVREAK